MAGDFDLEELVHLEQTLYEAGYADGFAHGRIHGLIEGRALGREKGFEIWEEIGFYEGFARTWKAIYAQRVHPDQRATLARHVSHLVDLVRQFPTVNPSSMAADSDAGSPPAAHGEIDMSTLQSQIRARYKALCASLGVRPMVRAGAGAGAGTGASVATGDTGEGQRANETLIPSPSPAKRDVWTLEGDVRRPTKHGLSF